MKYVIEAGEQPLVEQTTRLRLKHEFNKNVVLQVQGRTGSWKNMVRFFSSGAVDFYDGTTTVQKLSVSDY